MELEPFHTNFSHSEVFALSPCKTLSPCKNFKEMVKEEGDSKWSPGSRLLSSEDESEEEATPALKDLHSKLGMESSFR